MPSSHGLVLRALKSATWRRCRGAGEFGHALLHAARDAGDAMPILARVRAAIRYAHNGNIVTPRAARRVGIPRVPFSHPHGFEVLLHRLAYRRSTRPRRAWPNSPGCRKVRTHRRADRDTCSPRATRAGGVLRAGQLKGHLLCVRDVPFICRARVRPRSPPARSWTGRSRNPRNAGRSPCMKLRVRRRALYFARRNFTSSAARSIGASALCSSSALEHPAPGAISSSRSGFVQRAALV